MVEAEVAQQHGSLVNQSLASVLAAAATVRPIELTAHCLNTCPFSFSSCIEKGVVLKRFSKLVEE